MEKPCNESIVFAATSSCAHESKAVGQIQQQYKPQKRTIGETVEKNRERKGEEEKRRKGQEEDRKRMGAWTRNERKKEDQEEGVSIQTT